MLYDEGFLNRLAAALRAALPLWDVGADTRLELLTISENATFRASGTGRGADLVFRVHRPDYHTKAEILSELAWIDALRAEGVVRTPQPIALKEGGRIADIADDGHLRHVVAFEFVPGKEPDESDDLAGWFKELGAIHARLHDHARRWSRPEGFTRKVWDFESTLGAKPLWGDFRAGLGLDAAGRAVLERAAGVLERKLGPLSSPEDFGLIHADLRLANLLVDQDKLALIDFDDCGFSWFLYDFAAAISFIEHEPYIPELRAAWLEGYGAVAPVPGDAQTRLDLFVMLRRILLTAWIASHAETPTAQAMGVSYTQGSVDLAEAFLKRHG